MLALAACSDGNAAHTEVSDNAQATQGPLAPVAPDLPTVSKLINDAIAAHRLPGAVVVIGHGGKVVFKKAYGVRKLAGEQGLDGSRAPAEPMTEDTIFDMASLTKPLATATAVMQLYEQGRVQFDDPVQKYLPDFNPSNDPQRAEGSRAKGSVPTGCPAGAWNTGLLSRIAPTALDEESRADREESRS